MEFVYPHISPIAILAAAVAQFAIGFLWYSPMLPTGQRWIAEMNIRPGEQRPGAEMIAFPVGSIVAAWAASMVFSWSGATGLAQGVLAAWVVGMAVGAQVLTTAVANSQRSVPLLAINLGYVFVGYGVMGALIGLLA